MCEELGDVLLQVLLHSQIAADEEKFTIEDVIDGIAKKMMHDKKIKKEDRLYYFDAMTNLKNRNYLNDNMDFWSSTKVYPQAIIVIDINKLKSLNDR